jgi:tetratricopeptide (TPR) repeat protein
MPAYGDFETVGDPLAVTEELHAVATVWRARRSGGGDRREYALKLYAPKREAAEEPSAEDTRVLHLEHDAGLWFAEGIKDLQRAGKHARGCLAKIHALNATGEGVWYVTDFCPRTLAKFATLRGRVDSEGLRHVVWSVVIGCLALKRARGYGHGNLKLNNIFLMGAGRALGKIPVQLADPYAPAARQWAALDADARQLLAQQVEAQDLHAIGELIFQMVEGRLIRPGEQEHEYPIRFSPAWQALGKEAGPWLERCNRLVNPSLKLEEMNLEALERELRPSAAAANLKWILAGAATTVVVAAGLAWAIHAIAQWQKQSQAARQKEAAALAADINAGNQFLAQTNFSGAAAKYAEALELAGKLKEDLKRQDAENRQVFAQALVRASQLEREGQFGEELQELKKASNKSPGIASVDEYLGQCLAAANAKYLAAQAVASRQEFEAAMSRATSLLKEEKFAPAAKAFQEALAQEGLPPADLASAAAGKELANDLEAAGHARDTQEQIRFLAAALAIGNVPVDNAFMQALGARYRQATNDLAVKHPIPSLPTPKETFDGLVKEGNSWLDEGSYANAADSFRKALGVTGVRQADRDVAQADQQFAEALASAQRALQSHDPTNEIRFLETARNARNKSLSVTVADHLQAWYEEATKRLSDVRHLEWVNEFTGAIQQGNRGLAQTNYLTAAEAYQNALNVAKGLDKSSQQDAGLRLRLAQILTEAETARGKGLFELESERLQSVVALMATNQFDLPSLALRVNDRLLESRQDLDAVRIKNELSLDIKNGNLDLSAGHYALAATNFQSALALARQITNGAGGELDAIRRLHYAQFLAQAERARAAGQGQIDLELQSLDQAEKLRPLIADVDQTPLDNWLADAGKRKKTQTPPPNHQPISNFLGVPDFNFVWVPQIHDGEGAYVEITELSRRQYQNLLRKSPPPPDTADQPAELSFDQARELCGTCGDLLGKQNENGAGKFVLPSERDFLIFSGVGVAGPANPPTASLKDLLRSSLANTRILDPNVRTNQLRSVANGQANPLGLIHVLGNAWQWCDNGGAGVPAGFDYHSEGFGPSGSLFADKSPLDPADDEIGVRLLYLPAPHH